MRVIDGLLTCGRGQRVGIFAGAGCGKSVLVEQIASQADADVIVVGLVGERGREVREMLVQPRRDRMVIVAATADRSPLERIRGALAATAIAEYFRDRGKNVLLVLDSLTRYRDGAPRARPRARRAAGDEGLSAERVRDAAAPARARRRRAPAGGSITAFYTVLVEGDDLSDPGRRLGALAARRPHRAVARPRRPRSLPRDRRARERIARRAPRRQARDARRSRAGRASTCRAAARPTSCNRSARTRRAPTPSLDIALAVGDRIDTWSRQAPYERTTYDETVRGLAAAIGEELQS